MSISVSSCRFAGAPTPQAVRHALSVDREAIAAAIGTTISELETADTALWLVRDQYEELHEVGADADTVLRVRSLREKLRSEASVFASRLESAHETALRIRHVFSQTEWIQKRAEEAALYRLNTVVLQRLTYRRCESRSSLVESLAALETRLSGEVSAAIASLDESVAAVRDNRRTEKSWCRRRATNRRRDAHLTRQDLARTREEGVKLRRVRQQALTAALAVLYRLDLALALAASDNACYARPGPAVDFLLV